MSLEKMERKLIEATLEHFGGHRAKTAKALGIGLRTLSGKLRQYGYAPREKPLLQRAGLTDRQPVGSPRGMRIARIAEAEPPIDLPPGGTVEIGPVEDVSSPDGTGRVYSMIATQQ